MILRMKINMIKNESFAIWCGYGGGISGYDISGYDYGHVDMDMDMDMDGLGILTCVFFGVLYFMFDWLCAFGVLIYSCFFARVFARFFFFLFFP